MAKRKKKTRKGRPPAVNSKREKFSITLSLAEGAMSDLFDRYDTEQNATALRKAVHELLGITEDENKKVDSNSSRQRRKEKALELETTVANLNRIMEENNCTLEEVSSFF